MQFQHLTEAYFLAHKEAGIAHGFGMDGTPELIDFGFGIYSTANTKYPLGPVRTNFYQIGFCREPTLTVELGLSTYHHTRNTVHFSFPGQVFSIYDKAPGSYCLYMLFTQDFIQDLLPDGRLQQQYPFLDYHGIPFFLLSEAEGLEMEACFQAIDLEVKTKGADRSRAIKLYLNLALILAKRSYLRQQLAELTTSNRPASLLERYKKLVAQHFLTLRNVAEYAERLAVSAQHLSRVVKQESGQSPVYFINEMILREAKALLRYSEMRIGEIAYQLDFTDPSHFTKFFKRYVGITPLAYREAGK